MTERGRVALFVIVLSMCAAKGATAAIEFSPLFSLGGGFNSNVNYATLGQEEGSPFLRSSLGGELDWIDDEGNNSIGYRWELTAYDSTFIPGFEGGSNEKAQTHILRNENRWEIYDFLNLDLNWNAKADVSTDTDPEGNPLRLDYITITAPELQMSYSISREVGLKVGNETRWRWYRDPARNDDYIYNASGAELKARIEQGLYAKLEGNYAYKRFYERPDSSEDTRNSHTLTGTVGVMHIPTLEFIYQAKAGWRQNFDDNPYHPSNNTYGGVLSQVFLSYLLPTHTSLTLMVQYNMRGYLYQYLAKDASGNFLTGEEGYNLSFDERGTDLPPGAKLAGNRVDHYIFASFVTTQTLMEWLMVEGDYHLTADLSNKRSFVAHEVSAGIALQPKFRFE